MRKLNCWDLESQTILWTKEASPNFFVDIRDNTIWVACWSRQDFFKILHLDCDSGKVLQEVEFPGNYFSQLIAYDRYL